MTTRREAIRAAGITALSYSRVLGANDRVQLGVIGTGGRGQYVMTVFQKTGQVDVRAVCDVYGLRTDEAQTKAPNSAAFSDHRKLLETKEIDAVLIATPDHWHKHTAIDALNAGKDVYVEKPLTLRRQEGPEIVRAARMNDRVCQVGMQQRSGTVYREAKQRFVDGGLLGKVSHVRCVWDSGPGRALPTEPATKPGNLDWARFLGPVRWREWNPAQYLNYRAFLDFGGGKLTDFGAHWVDVAHMFLGVDAPLSAVASGGVYNAKDGRTAPDTISALWEYPGLSVSFVSLSTPNPEPARVEFLGDGGKLWITRNRYEFTPAGKGSTPVAQSFPGDITAEHVRNFLDCCRTRQKPNGDVHIGHRSAQAVLLANDSYLERRKLWFDGEREEVLSAGV